MSTPRPRIAIVCCRKQLEEQPQYQLAEKYVLAAQDGAGGLPFLIPPAPGAMPAAEYLPHFDALMLSGSPSNIEPHRYGAVPQIEDDISDPHRDDMTLALVRAFVAAGKPVMAICRGLQEINVALGGSLFQQVQKVDGRSDHRMAEDGDWDYRYRPVHPIALRRDGLLHRITGRNELQVNSLHQQGIDRLAPSLTVEATAPDGTVEAVALSAGPGFLLGVQWHPEWKFWEDEASRRIFAAFGDAARQEAAGETRLAVSA